MITFNPAAPLTPIPSVISIPTLPHLHHTLQFTSSSAPPPISGTFSGISYPHLKRLLIFLPTQYYYGPPRTSATPTKVFPLPAAVANSTLHLPTPQCSIRRFSHKLTNPASGHSTPLQVAEAMVLLPVLYLQPPSGDISDSDADSNNALLSGYGNTEDLDGLILPNYSDSEMAEVSELTCTASEGQSSHYHSHPFIPAPSKKTTEDAAKMLSEIQMLQLFHVYSSGRVSVMNVGWIRASEWVATSWNHGPSYASQLQRWCHDFMANIETIPTNPYGKWNESILVTDEDLRHEIEAHLRSLGPHISAMDIVHFLNTPEMRERLSRNKPISVQTAQRQLKGLGYHWQREKRGQYSDGHEQDDVVQYQQHVFLPAMAGYEKSMRKWDENGEEIPDSSTAHCIVAWFHDESIFCAPDHQKVRWVHNSKTVKPYAKGEADYGWLKGHDGCNARVMLRLGSNRDGYFTNDDVIEQCQGTHPD
ncbi:uncharacterized protein EI90DRAFT_3120203 [Cantharellus anzutake]|uniref:uncharacterized protein n=1 Tax=Cantharellus anzutake TaxID=1750568 RepID=UPI001902F8CA|nr:uncharacterized protein EI90DRAFT_3120203 [Cantharellus anzutake]KAF8335967.1 hypothetical protein EI90DRAFT_3120203 [Cantharellus anzutake]